MKIAQVSDDVHYMRLALVEATKAFQEREVPVGALLVRKGVIIAKDHNRCEAEKDPTAHAEILVIRKGAFSLKTWRLEDTSIYVTKEPCPMCAGAMINARIATLVYGCHDHKGGAVKSLYHLLKDNRLNHQVDVLGGVLEYECAAILKKFFKNLRSR